jgi:hypothetical protein
LISCMRSESALATPWEPKRTSISSKDKFFVYIGNRCQPCFEDLDLQFGVKCRFCGLRSYLWKEPPDKTGSHEGHNSEEEICAVRDVCQHIRSDLCANVSSATIVSTHGEDTTYGQL